jgi:hypothetical protein
MLTPLEKGVLDVLLDSPEEPYISIRQQMDYALVTSREFTGVGFFTRFTLPADAPVRRDLPNANFTHVGADIAGLKHGAGFVLFIRDGVVSMLEGFTYVEAWPQTTDEFRVYRLQK